jgi:hypothetical protein
VGFDTREEEELTIHVEDFTHRKNPPSPALLMGGFQLHCGGGISAGREVMFIVS